MGRKLATCAATLLVLAGCSGPRSSVVLKSGLPPVPPEQVQLYTSAPAGAVEVALVEAQGHGLGQQAKTDDAIQGLKVLARQAGGNGVVITNMGSGPNGAILTGVGTGGPVMAIPTQGKPIIRGVAVYVPK